MSEGQQSILAEVRQRVEAEESAVVATVVAGPAGVGSRMLIYPNGSARGSLGSAELDAKARGDYRERLLKAESKTVEYAPADGQGEPTLVFYDVYPSPDRLLIFGGVHAGVPLTELAKVLGFRVTVVDARGQWANRERFPKADEIVVGYADEFLATARMDLSTYVVVLTHDPKLDDPAIIEAVKHDVRYIGAIGSRRTHAGRIERLKGVGLTDEQLAKVHAPIGLDIRARNPEEIALSILAEIVAAKNGVDTLGRHGAVRTPVPA
ncbi:MAG: XdhC family protein [Chloroflexi bacterium]|nr:XdhC family protein [Chloroflexota bacterium]